MASMKEAVRLGLRLLAFIGELDVMSVQVLAQVLMKGFEKNVIRMPCFAFFPAEMAADILMIPTEGGNSSPFQHPDGYKWKDLRVDRLMGEIACESQIISGEEFQMDARGRAEEVHFGQRIIEFGSDIE